MLFDIGPVSVIGSFLYYYDLPLALGLWKHYGEQGNPLFLLRLFGDEYAHCRTYLKMPSDIYLITRSPTWAYHTFMINEDFPKVETELHIELLEAISKSPSLSCKILRFIRVMYKSKTFKRIVMSALNSNKIEELYSIVYRTVYLYYVDHIKKDLERHENGHFLLSYIYVGLKWYKNRKDAFMKSFITKLIYSQNAEHISGLFKCPEILQAYNFISVSPTPEDLKDLEEVIKKYPGQDDNLRMNCEHLDEFYDHLDAKDPNFSSVAVSARSLEELQTMHHRSLYFDMDGNKLLDSVDIGLLCPEKRRFFMKKSNLRFRQLYEYYEKNKEYVRDYVLHYDDYFSLQDFAEIMEHDYNFFKRNADRVTRSFYDTSDNVKKFLEKRVIKKHGKSLKGYIGIWTTIIRESSRMIWDENKIDS